MVAYRIIWLRSYIRPDSILGKSRPAFCLSSAYFTAFPSIIFCSYANALSSTVLSSPLPPPLPLRCLLWSPEKVYFQVPRNLWMMAIITSLATVWTPVVSLGERARRSSSWSQIRNTLRTFSGFLFLPSTTPLNAPLCSSADAKERCMTNEYCQISFHQIFILNKSHLYFLKFWGKLNRFKRKTPSHSSGNHPSCLLHLKLPFSDKFLKILWMYAPLPQLLAIFFLLLSFLLGTSNDPRTMANPVLLVPSPVSPYQPVSGNHCLRS